MKATKFFTLAIIYLASIVVAPSHARAPPPQPDFYVDSPSPSQGSVASLETCAKKLTEKCGDEILSGVFQDTAITKECCKDLKKMGKLCQDEIVKAFLSIPLVQPSRAEESQILSKSTQIWSQCVSLGHVVGEAAVSPSPSRSSFE
ncbi:unnamed protein product [Ilex paraguariensis]|uniref:Prolamin-like domain-containing protein n=1 Tax=Ilex paraguariensis TaxID=185542 RepID=A0ABC8V491_9AQUA